MDKRKDYWNKDYYEYWKKRVKEANEFNTNTSQIQKGDCKTSSDAQYLELINLLGIDTKDKVLELGCGFGRSIPALKEKSKEVFAVDISEAMINDAKEKFEKEKNIHFYVSEAEKLPFEYEKFDKIVCFASFDAFYQKEALIEINRILKPGGRVLITGKNDHYFEDDEAAYVAEVNARKKGHPNYFTNLHKLLANLSYFGFKLENRRYGLRRGDFEKNQYKFNLPNKFYMYMVIFSKNSTPNPQVVENLNIYSFFSKNFSKK